MHLKSQVTEKVIEHKRSEKLLNTEICLVVLTGLCKFFFADYLPFRHFFLPTACIVWLVYLLAYKRNWIEWGFNWGLRNKSFRNALLILLVPGLVLSASFIRYGVKNHPEHPDWLSLAVTMVVYPIWGIVQQFMMMALIAGNLRTLSNKKLKPLSIALITAVVFSAVHFPIIELAIVTFPMALCYALLYLRHKSLVPLGIFHGWLGALFYYFVLNRSAW